MGETKRLGSNFFLDNTPLRMLALGQVDSVCDAARLHSILDAEGFFSPDSFILLPVFLTLEFLGVSTKELARPTIDVNSFGPSFGDRIQGIFEEATRFFRYSSAVSQDTLINYWVARHNRRADTILAQHIFQAVWERILQPGFRDELCWSLATDELCRANISGLGVGDTNVSGAVCTDSVHEVESNTEILRCLIEMRSRLGIGLPVARIVNRICRSSFRSNVKVLTDKGPRTLANVAKFREKEDGADMECIDFSILGHQGQPVTCVTFDSFNQVALRMAAVRYWYKEFLGRNRQLSKSADVQLIDGCILQITNSEVRRISPELLCSTDIPFEGL